MPRWTDLWPPRVWAHTGKYTCTPTCTHIYNTNNTLYPKTKDGYYCWFGVLCLIFTILDITWQPSMEMKWNQNDIRLREESKAKDTQVSQGVEDHYYSLLLTMLKESLISRGWCTFGAAKAWPALALQGAGVPHMPAPMSSGYTQAVNKVTVCPSPEL